MTLTPYRHPLTKRDRRILAILQNGGYMTRDEVADQVRKGGSAARVEQELEDLRDRGLVACPRTAWHLTRRGKAIADPADLPAHVERCDLDSR